MNLHFIGIGGIGMSALAQWCLHRGDGISGSDRSDSPIVTLLRDKGINVIIGQQKENVPKRCDAVIYSEAILFADTKNPELEEAKKQDIPQYSYFEYLGKCAKDFRTIAVAGTHGKTTTTGLIANGFLSARFDATVVVGSTLKELGNTNFRPGSNEWLLVEACEYRNNFRFLSPEVVILTSVDHDHVDAFPTKASYFQVFESFIQSAKMVIAHADDLGSQRVLRDFTGEIQWVTPSSQMVKISLLGEFNRRNAALALALGKSISALNTETFQQGIQSFVGAGRRQEFLGDVGGIQIYDDYAHHPHEVSALLNGFREKFPTAKIGLIFEPHQFSRTKQFFMAFLEAFSFADEVGLFPIYEARDSEEDKQFSLSQFFEKHPEYSHIQEARDIDIFLRKFAPNDVIVFCGAGKIGQFVRHYLKDKRV